MADKRYGLVVSALLAPRRTLHDLRGQEGNARQVHSPGSLRNCSQFAAKGLVSPCRTSTITSATIRLLCKCARRGRGPTVLRAVSTHCQLSRMEFCDEASQYTFH